MTTGSIGQSNLIDDNLTGVGMATIGRPVTKVLYVSPNGSDEGGRTWATAYTNPADALDWAQANKNDYDATLILFAPHGGTYYDINRTGDPTWSCNVILKGPHRNWPKIMNDHVGATSIMKLTGRASVEDLNYNLGTSNNGLIITRGGGRVRHCQFVGANMTGAGTALWFDTVDQKHFKADDIDFLGKDGTLMTAFKVDALCCSEFTNLRIHKCLKGIQIVGATSDENIFDTLDIGECAIGIDIDAGNEQHINEVTFHGNTVNIDDVVQDHYWTNIHGAFPITTSPDDLAGVTLTAGVGANTWAADVQVRAAAAKPFRVVGVVLDPDAAEKYRVRLYDGATYFSDVWAEGGVGVAAKGTSAPSGTEFIFNQGTVISASAKSETGGNDIDVSLQIQEI